MSVRVPYDHRLSSFSLQSDENGDHEGQISHPHTNNGFFFLLTMDFLF